MAVLVGSTRLDHVNARSRQYQLGRALATLAMTIPFLLGWLVHKTVMVIWLTVAWLWAAVVVGWESASTGNPKGRGG